MWFGESGEGFVFDQAAHLADINLAQARVKNQTAVDEPGDDSTDLLCPDEIRTPDRLERQPQ